MKEISLIHLCSVLNGQDAALKSEEYAFLGQIDPQGEFSFRDENKSLPALFFVQTGGSEPVFLSKYQDYPEPYMFLVTGTRNSLAASLEMLSFLHKHGKKGKILMGDPKLIHDEIDEYLRFYHARDELSALRLGVIGKPSDWLIASDVDYKEAKKRLGVELVDIDYDELIQGVEAVKEVPEALLGRFASKTDRKFDLEESLKIYIALKDICVRHGLGGFTLRCFDLLNIKHQTSCLAFGLLNEEGILSGCEGDVPALLTMALSKALFGYAPFMANPSTFHLETNVALYAHCTLPLNFCKSFDLHTHFESGLGIGIRGEIDNGPVTCFKIAPNLSSIMALEGEIIKNPYLPTMCRSQIEVHFDSPLSQIVENPYGNHMVFAFGKHAKTIADFFAFLG